MRTAIFLMIFGGLWFSLTATETIAPLYLPNPVDVVNATRWSLLEGTASTVARTLVGFCIGVTLAYVFHFAALFVGFLGALDSQIAAARALPTIALMPLFILWFGFAEYGRVVVIVMTALAFYIAPLHGAFRNLPREWSFLGGKMRWPLWRYYSVVVVPATLGELLGACRVTMAISFTIAIASDYMGAQTGLGKFIDSARVTFNVPGIFLAIIVAGVAGLTLDSIILYVYRRNVHWMAQKAKF